MEGPLSQLIYKLDMAGGILKGLCPLYFNVGWFRQRAHKIEAETASTSVHLKFTFTMPSSLHKIKFKI